ncbi:hypothetical protein [Leptolyngbya sp. FACHB-321]|uniref:hypothetical protein n=1 Tax=Leptolyngbya sp. FACHB-321 TaxID=2692807 RepID=UPI001F558BB9|nr:hypothetical protein [Leptolyngbya sp. FACHB-321]
MSKPLNSTEQECNPASPDRALELLISPPRPYPAGYQSAVSDFAMSDLPANFPDVEVPRFLYGDRLRWLSNGELTDWGIAVGRFYSFAPHRCCWHWCYLIWLDPDSPSAAWVQADIAWEDDLEPLEAEESL